MVDCEHSMKAKLLVFLRSLLDLLKTQYEPQTYVDGTANVAV